MDIELSCLSESLVRDAVIDRIEDIAVRKAGEDVPHPKAAFRKFVAENDARAGRNLAEAQLGAGNVTAPMQNNQELAQILMKYGKNKYGWSALNYAINCEDYHAAIILIENGANCFQSDKNNYHAYCAIERMFMNTCKGKKPADVVGLHWKLKAFSEDKQESAKLLVTRLLKEYVLRKGPNSFPHAQDILEGLIANKWYDHLEYIFENKYHLRFQHIIRWANLYSWLVEIKDLKAMSVLDKISSPAQLKERLITLEARLAMAIRHNSLEMVKYFVERGASVKGSLSQAMKAKGENKDMIEFLISKGATL